MTDATKPSPWVSVAAWLRQTSTIAGLATIAGTAAAAAMGSITWPVAIPTLVGAVVAIALPGAPDAKAVAEKAAAAAIAQAARKP